MKKETAEQISEMIDSKRDDLIRFSQVLVKQSSETPPGDERAVCELIRKKASEWGLPEPVIWAKKANRPNIVFTLKGERNEKVLIFNGHTDTKPMGDVLKWTIDDPYTPRIIDGKLYGRGTTDMKGSVVGMLGAAWAISSCRIPLKGDLILALTADEEGGSEYGARVLVEKGLKADAVLVGEPSGVEKSFDSLCLACRGTINGKIVVHGTQMHSSLSDRVSCVNASVKMAKVLTEFAENLKKQMNYKSHYLYPSGPTINPGVILDGGIFYGVIPGEASFGFDIRVIPGMTLEGVKRDLRNFLSKLESKDKALQAELVLENPPLGWAPPVEISEDHPLVSLCKEATKLVVGEGPDLTGFAGTTDARFFAHELGIPTIPAFGPGLITLAHGPDEYVEVKAIVDAAKIFALSAIGYLNDS